MILPPQTIVVNPTYSVLLKENYAMAEMLLDNGASIDVVFVSRRKEVALFIYLTRFRLNIRSYITSKVGFL